MRSESAYEKLLARLTPEEKKAFEAAQKNVVAKAKKESAQRRMDDNDRRRVKECLAKVDADAKMSLSAARILALRWVLDKYADEFGQYVKMLHGGEAKSQTDVVDPATYATRQEVARQGGYKRPVEQQGK